MFCLYLQLLDDRLAAWEVLELRERRPQVRCHSAEPFVQDLCLIHDPQSLHIVQGQRQVALLMHSQHSKSRSRGIGSDDGCETWQSLVLSTWFLTDDPLLPFLVYGICRSGRKSSTRRASFKGRSQLSRVCFDYSMYWLPTNQDHQGFFFFFFDMQPPRSLVSTTRGYD